MKNFENNYSIHRFGKWHSWSWGGGDDKKYSIRIYQYLTLPSSIIISTDFIKMMIIITTRIHFQEIGSFYVVG